MGTVGVAPGTSTLTLADGTSIALSDWIDDKFYGSVQLSNAFNQLIEAFSTGRSQAIPGGARNQARVDTNIPRQGENGLPKDWEMLVFGIGIQPTRCMRPITGNTTTPVLADGSGALSDPVSLRAWFGMERVVYLEYIYNSKAYTQGVMGDYPQGSGTQVFSTNSNIELANNGVPSPRDRAALVLPIHERENLGYKMTFQPDAAPVLSVPASDGGTALTFMDVKIKKFGLIKRTVV
jgi:hypothetical protein